MNSVPSVIIENDNSEKNNIVKELELALSEFNYKGNENLIFYKSKVSLPRKYISFIATEIIKCKKDPIYFADSYFYIISLKKGKTIIQTYAKQKELIRECFDKNRLVVLASRQTGKTTSYSIFTTHYICFSENKKVLIVANKLETAIGILDNIKFAFELLPKWLKPKVIQWNKKSIKLDNGCVVECTATSSNAARSKSANCLIIDECAFINEKLILEFWKSVYPILSSDINSKCIMVSTPNGMGNLYYRTYQSALVGKFDDTGEKWYPFRIDWWDFPGRDENWRKQQLVSLQNDEKAFAQEFGNDFLGSAYTLVSPDRVYQKKNLIVSDKLNDKCSAYSFMNKYECKIWEFPQKNKCYILGGDIADGTGNDFSVLTVWDITNPSVEISLVAEFSNNIIDPVETAYITAKLGLMYNYCPVSVERNGPGATVLQFLNKVYEYENILTAGSSKMIGIFSNNELKNRACQNFKKYFNHININLFIPSMQLLNELESFEKVELSKTGFTYRGKDKCNDDHVMSTVWAFYILEQNNIEMFFDAKYQQIGLEILPTQLKIAYPYADFSDKENYVKIDKHLDTLFTNLSRESSNLNNDLTNLQSDDFLSNWFDDFMSLDKKS